MYDEDRDALAAEYVLGTLSADERDQAEALLVIDPGFAEIVRVWERRLGELNVMVEAVDPPPDLWDKIRGEIVGEPRRDLAEPLADQVSPEIAPEPEPEADRVPEPSFDPVPEPAFAEPQDLDELNPPRDLDESAPSLDETSLVDALASSLESPEDAEVAADALLPPDAPMAVSSTAPGADVLVLRRGVRRWRAVTAVMTAIAAVLALFVAVTQFAPGLMPLSRQPAAVATLPAPAGGRLTAVLKQEPTAPAFLLTVDPASKTITVRTVSAAPESGRSYQLWLISSHYPRPRSLGLIGDQEFTSRPLPAGIDVNTIRSADYAVSLEPAGGSPSDIPTGPILFTGKMVESLPQSPG